MGRNKMRDSFKIDQSMESVYKEHAAAWGGVDVILRACVGDLIECSYRLFRFMAEHKGRIETLTKNPSATVALRSDLAQSLAGVVISLEQTSVLLGTQPENTVGRQPINVGDLAAASILFMGRLVELARDVNAHINLRENTYRAGEPIPSGSYLGSKCLEIREIILDFNQALAVSYPYDKSDFEQSLRHRLDLIKTNRPETTYRLREVEQILDEPVTKNGEVIH
jgi:hypothetical protein